MKVGRSKSNLPTVTENGGGMSNTGYATIICGPNGQKLKPLFIPRGYSNGDHAIFVVQLEATHLVYASRGRRGEAAQIEKVVSVDGDELRTEMVGEYENGDGNIPPQFQPAVSAAIEKTKCYHCREPHFAVA